MSLPNAAPTLEDVAKSASVSTATVSRCLNAPDKVSEHTRISVMKAVEALGYTPNFGARVMAAKRSFTIGAIIPTMDNAIFARGLQAFQEKLHEKGYTLLVSSSAYRPDVEAEQVRALVGRGADGLLLIGYDRAPSVYEFLAQRDVPTLVSWAYSKDSPHTSIGFDNRASCKALCEKVLSMGHRKIAYISGVVAGNDRAAERLAGFRDGLTSRSINPDQAPVVEAFYDIASGADAFGEVMAGAPKTTVVMCGNDVLAVGAMQRARKMGLKVPRDVSITGFDDIEIARIVSPKLTTVHVPHAKMGRKAAGELIRMVEKQSDGVSVQLESSIKLRRSLRALT